MFSMRTHALDPTGPREALEKLFVLVQKSPLDVSGLRLVIPVGMRLRLSSTHGNSTYIG